MKRLGLPVLVGIVIVLVIGAVVLFSQTTASPSCEGQGACMLYFFADD